MKATSLRLPVPVHRATAIATQLGMDDSFTAATTAALLDRLHGFLRQRALADHLARFPEDVPALAAVVARRVSGTDHPAAHHPDLAARLAAAYERRDPTGASAGRAVANVAGAGSIASLRSDRGWGAVVGGWPVDGWPVNGWPVNGWSVGGWSPRWRRSSRSGARSSR